MSIQKTIGVFAAILCSTTLANAQNISVRVNGNNVPFADTMPQMQGGRVLVPLRGVLEQIGADINWNEATQTVKARMNQRNIELTLGRRMAMVNGQQVRLGVPAMRIGGSTMVPLRFLSEALGASVDWNDSRQEVNITTNGANLPNRIGNNGNGNGSGRNNGGGRRDGWPQAISLRIDGRDQSFGAAKPYARDNQVMVPLEFMSEQAHFSYRYDPDQKTVAVGEKGLRHDVGSRWGQQGRTAYGSGNDERDAQRRSLRPAGVRPDGVGSSGDLEPDDPHRLTRPRAAKNRKSVAWRGSLGPCD